MSADRLSDDRWEEEDASELPEFLRDPIGVVQRRVAALVASFAIGLVVTAGLLIGWKPSYLAYATCLITSQAIPEDFVQSTVREDSLANINAMIGRVLSAEHLSRLIDERGMFTDDDVPRIDLINELRSRIVVAPQSSQSRNPDALVYEISYESDDPEEAADVANALASLFVEVSLARRNAQAKQTTVFLRKELERDEAKLREQSRLVSEFRREYRGALPDELQTNLRKVEVIAARRESLTQQIAAKENRIATLTATSDTIAPSENQVLLSELRRQLAQQSAINTEEHPNVISLRERIKRLEQADAKGGMRSQAHALIDAERRDIETMREQIVRADAEIVAVNEQIDRTPRVTEELAALQQKEQVLREDYLSALRKVEAAELAESLESAQQGGQVSVLDNASPPNSPVRPRWIVALVGLALSAGLAVSVAVLLELIDPVVVGARYVRKMSDAPVLGSLPWFA